ncbi:MAG: phosphomevalonate kinase, partial [Micropruina sp.]|uniref:phosphomevalonate kinase n=1 Tax=Micropruina sp. TaxID=2737536 RepID=UPI0039E3AB8B
MITTRAPGKLFVAGEYAVVEPGEPAVLIAVDRYLSVELTESTGIGRIRSGEYGPAPLEWTRAADGVGVVVEHRPSDYVLSALALVERLRDELGIPPRYFDLQISSELDDAQGRKFGLGSSAAVTVAVIAALDEFYRLALSRTERFKLALLATVQVSPNASGGDLAACTFGGWVGYTAPDRAALRAELTRSGVSATVNSPAWAHYRTIRLAPPSTLELLVGWTGTPASTERLVDGVRHGRDDRSAAYGRILRASGRNVQALERALQADDAAATLGCLRTARRVLQELGELSGIVIETPALRALCDAAERCGAAGKPSGAGGGDCGIV